MPALPPELWLCVFHHATHVPGALVPDVYAYASLFGTVCTKSCDLALRSARATERALVRVCKQWWHLATPSLYVSIHISRTRCLSSLATTLLRSAAGKGTFLPVRPLGEYTQRLDIAVRDHSKNAEADLDLLAAIITCMPHLAIVAFAIAPGCWADLPNCILLDALHHSATSLRVLDWSSTCLEPSPSRVADLLAKCTQLRVLNCPRLVWSSELQYGGIPLTVTSLRVQALIPIQIATACHLHPHFDPAASCHPGPSALQELILDLYQDFYHWKDLIAMYSSQLVSIQFYMPNRYRINVEGHVQLLALLCPRLLRLTITADCFSSFIRPRLCFPSITYLGLRATQVQSPRPEYKALFVFLEELRSRVPSLQVVQLLSEYNVRCLLQTHTKFAVRALRPFMETASFRVEDRDGVLLTGSSTRCWVVPHGLID